MNRTLVPPDVAHGAGREAAHLSRALEADHFRGWDPYDALSSPVVRLVARQPFGRQAAIQFLKRSPINLRPLLAVPRRRHTKALALCISAYAELARLPDGERYETLAKSLAGDLADRLIVEGGTPAGWGYDFDVQTRWGFYPAGKPNAVVTAFSLKALRAVSALPGDSARLAELGVRVSRAVDGTFGIHDEPFFGYYGGSRTPIHNASVLLASAVGQWADMDAAVIDDARRAVHFTVSRQAPDGSWPYGERRGLEWVDGYHTAYILVALERWLTTREDEAVEAALYRGVRFYIDQLFEVSGAPRGTVDRCYPIDIHGASSAIWALTLLRRRSGEALPLANRVLDWTRAHMRRSDGHYAFQLHQRYRNSIPYIRWNDAHMLLALATLASTEDDHAI